MLAGGEQSDFLELQPDMCSLILRGGEHHSMNRDRGGGGRGGGGGGGGWGRDGQMDLKVHFVSWSQYINMRGLISGESCRIVFINAFIVLTILIGRMNWRWRGEEEGETGTRGGAGAAAGNKLSKKAHTKIEGLNFKVF